jgi:hypothetical protein
MGQSASVAQAPTSESNFDPEKPTSGIQLAKELEGTMKDGYCSITSVLQQ